VGVFAGVLTAEVASAAVSPVLLVSTVRASTAFAASITGATAAGLVSASVASLAEGVTTTMIVSKLKIVAGLALAGVLTLGVGAATAQKLGGPAEGEKAVQKAADTLEDQIAKLRKQAIDSEARARILEMEVKTLREQLEAVKAANEAALKKSVTSGPNQTTKGQGMGLGGGDARAGRGGNGVGDGGGFGPPGGFGGGGGFGRSGGTSGGGFNKPGGIGAAQKDDPESLHTLHMGAYTIAYKPKSGKVSAYRVASGEWTSYHLPKGVEAVPIGGPNLAGLVESGDEIHQVAVYSATQGKWFPIDLKEPAKGEVTPSIAPGLAAYTIGRRVYAFSSTTHTWDVLELEEGAKPALITLNSHATVEHNGHLYTFNAKTGKWTDFDAKTGQMVTPQEK
jgi:hypothetical protein